MVPSNPASRLQEAGRQVQCPLTEEESWAPKRDKEPRPGARIQRVPGLPQAPPPALGSGGIFALMGWAASVSLGDFPGVASTGALGSSSCFGGVDSRLRSSHERCGQPQGSASPTQQECWFGRWRRGPLPHCPVCVCVCCLNISFIRSSLPKGRERCVHEKVELGWGSSIPVCPGKFPERPQEGTVWGNPHRPRHSLASGKVAGCFVAATSWRVCQALSVKSLGR